MVVGAGVVPKTINDFVVPMVIGLEMMMTMTLYPTISDVDRLFVDAAVDSNFDSLIKSREIHYPFSVG